jgi:hypothetical protein
VLRRWPPPQPEGAHRLLAEAAPQDGPAYYPPRLTGLRGRHPRAFENAHTIRDGTFWQTTQKPRDTYAVYDLVVLGAGLGPAREDGETVDWQHFLSQTPLPHRSKQDILRVETGIIAYFPDRNSEQKKGMLSRISYGDFLSKIAKIDVFRVHASQCVLAGWNMMIA